MQPALLMGTRLKRIIWAIDAYQQADQVHHNVVQTLQALTRLNLLKAEIEPVYVVPPEYAMSYDFYFPQPVDFKMQALATLEDRLADVDLPGLTEPTVLDEPTFTKTRSAKALIDYAESTNADLIVTGTHGRHGAARMFVGSFAESLILYSPVAVLTVGARAKEHRKIGRILFPTDFGRESKGVFPRVLEFARVFDAKVTLLHTVFKPIRITPGVRPLPAHRIYVEQSRKRAEKAAQSFLKAARDRDVTCDLKIVAIEDAVSHAVVNFAEKNDFHLIAMAARSGRLSSALTGSITRQVVRSSAEPVWVLREKRLRLAEAKEAA